MISEQLREVLGLAVEQLRREGLIAQDVVPSIELARPARAEHGNFSTNLALGLARTMKMPPRAVADHVVQALPRAPWLARVEVAGPGFINFFLTHACLQETITAIVTQRERYGQAEPASEATSIQIEFVSANPTGPLHVGAGRNAVFGDVLARLLEAAGFSVSREYYINDAGRQIDLFAGSLEARYRQALGQDCALPEDGYRGEYLVKLGEELSAVRGDAPMAEPGEIRAWGLSRMLETIKATLDRLGVRFDSWFPESSLHESGRIAMGIDHLRKAGLVFEQEGATWFRSTQMGDSRDRVLVRSDGRPTYLASDVAYLIDKAERGFDRAIYVWGADHHGAVASLEAAGRALQLPIVVEVLLYQLVKLYAGGEEVRMSKRTGEFITLDELIDEVGADAARFTFLLRSLESDLDFNLDLVKARSQENPVYYVQYAYARICSILRHGLEQGIVLGPIGEAPLAELVHDSEEALVRLLGAYPEEVLVCAGLRGPHRLTAHARELAAAFHAFYRDCRVVSDDARLTQARLWLVEATRQVLANILAILGVAAPESM